MNMMKGKVALYNFAYHKPGWLDGIANVAKEEPWGKDNKILELYLRANFEIAKAQNKVYEDETNGIAFWKAGWLVNSVSDPIWLVYETNSTAKQKWQLKKVHTGECPIAGQTKDNFQVRYDPPEFNSAWTLHIEQKNIEHILDDPRNKERLVAVFGEKLAGNRHLVFRTVYGELELQRKQEAVITQWFFNDYQFLMPLFLTQPDQVELVATLTPNQTLKRYEVKTLLLPHYSYAYARAIVKNRAAFASWMMLSTDELDQTYAEPNLEE